MAQVARHVVRGGASYSRSIGITNRATPLALAWTGDQRARYSDFQVNEISQDGQVVHLCHVGLTDEQKKQGARQAPARTAETDGDTAADTEAAKPGRADQTTEVAAEDVNLLSTLAGDEFAQGLVRLFQGGSGDVTDGDGIALVKSEAIDDKSKRGQVHGEIRRIFRSAIETNTDDTGAIIAFRASSKKGRRRNRGARGQGRDKPSAEYLHFTLYKDNRDTMDAVNQISRMLRTKPQHVGYAGTKDKRASTAQRCSLRYGNQRALAAANGKLWGMATGDYEYRHEPIRLGDLLGNEFVIAIKNCKLVDGSAERAAPEILEALHTHAQATLNQMAAHGWINYYGHQRFGTHRIGTHEVGKLIIGGRWEEAVMALLYYDEDVARKAAAGEVSDEPFQREEYARHQACMLFRTGTDPEAAAKMMPPRFAAETCLLRHLTRLGPGSLKDYAGALTHITRGLRSMYLHAYQSYVWNHAASKRWELHGASVVEGDLVLADDDDDNDAVPDQEDSSTDDQGDAARPVAAEDAHAPPRVRPLTAEEALSGRYSIHDVVLPSPGYSVVYPTNALGRFYQDFMARDENGGLDPHKMRRLRREFSLPGHYRKLVCSFLAPPEITFRLYEDDAEQMHPTDLDLARPSRSGKRAAPGQEDVGVVVAAQSANKKVKLDADADAGGGGEGGGDDANVVDHDSAPDKTHRSDDIKPDSLPDKKPKIAALLRMQLAKSAYATVALRELMGDLPEPTETVPPTSAS
ncbi:hypothetical protein XA68_10567 [Ophiocordyceps unilateralis]|uniref:TRUD domain-containing protein n=1 Tax=Ophiocordyceps unilateralis TaxID=268505 RepID=A0A2A9PGN4_OPHUN|nr:hypothetical protein XA68_10567 [Ophiocordyceps unilateralis]